MPTPTMRWVCSSFYIRAIEGIVICENFDVDSNSDIVAIMLHSIRTTNAQNLYLNVKPLDKFKMYKEGTLYSWISRLEKSWDITY
jgi:hypothetical protein